MWLRIVAPVALAFVWHTPGYAALDIQHWRTANGARVYFVEAHELPMVQLGVGFDAGSARDPGDLSGLAHMVSLLLDEGAGERDADAIARTLESLGADVSSENGRDMSVVELRSLSDTAILDPAVDVLADVLSRPTFPEEAVERERERLLVRLQQQEQDPAEVAKRAFYAGLFSGHPYSRHPTGTSAGVRAVTRPDLVAFHRRYFTGANAVVSVVGDLTMEQARDIAERLVGGLEAGQAAIRVPAVADPSDPEIVRVEFPSNQSHLLMGQPGVARGDPDYFPLYVGNHILGGSGLVSRLAREIREERGLAYSVYSYFVPMRVRGPYIVGLQTRGDQAAVAGRLVLETVSRFATEGPTADEIEAAKKNITGGFPLQIDSNKKIAGNLLTIGFYGLPLDYLDTFSSRVEAVTLDDVRDAFRRRIHPQRLVQVTVGG